MSHSLCGLSANSPASDDDDDVQYVSGSRGEVIATLLQAIRDQHALLVLTGIGGVGKSAVLHAALAALAGEPIRVIRLDNPDVPRWILRALVGQILGRSIEVLTETEVAAAFTALTTAPACEAQVVVAVDDAQTLTDQARDYLLLISSLVHSGGPCLQLIMVERGDHRESRVHSELPAPPGRTAVRVTLEPFADAEAKDYLAFRLERVGGAIDEVLTHEATAAIVRHCAGISDRIDRVLAASIAIGACRGPGPLTDDIVEDAIASLEPTPELPVPFPVRITVSPASTTDRMAVPPQKPAAPPMLVATAAPISAGEPVVLAPVFAIASPPAPLAEPQIVVMPQVSPQIIGSGWSWPARAAAAAVFVAAFGCITSVHLGPEGHITPVTARFRLEGSTALAGALPDRGPAQVSAQLDNLPAGEFDTASVATTTIMSAVVAPAAPDEAPVEGQPAEQARPFDAPAVSQSPALDALAETVLALSPADAQVTPGPFTEMIGAVFQPLDPSEGAAESGAVSISLPASAPAAEPHTTAKSSVVILSNAASVDAGKDEAASVVEAAATVEAPPEPPAAPLPELMFASAHAQASLPSDGHPADEPTPTATAPVIATVVQVVAAQALTGYAGAVLMAAADVTDPDADNDGGDARSFSTSAPEASSVTLTPASAEAHTATLAVKSDAESAATTQGSIMDAPKVDVAASPVSTESTVAETVLAISAAAPDTVSVPSSPPAAEIAEGRPNLQRQWCQTPHRATRRQSKPHRRLPVQPLWRRNPNRLQRPGRTRLPLSATRRRCPRTAVPPTNRPPHQRQLRPQ